MHKKTILRITFALLIVFLSFPLYYIIETVTTSLVLKSITDKIKISKPKVEYLAFSNLESVIKKKFSGDEYVIYTSAKQTKGTADLIRDKGRNLLLNNTDILDVSGSAQSQRTGDIYHFECEYLNISNANNAIKLYKNFYIALEVGSTKAGSGKNSKNVIEMRGDSLTFHLSDHSISSDQPIIFNAKNMILVAGKFFYKENKITITNDVFADSKNMTISANEAEIILSSSAGLVQKQKLAIEIATFKGNVNLFDRQNNVSIVADTILLDKNKSIAFLEGNVKIRRPDGIITGNKLTYNLKQDFTKIEGKKNEMVEIKLKF